MKKQQRMMDVAINSLDRCSGELKSLMNHSDDMDPKVLAEINRIYYELGELYSELQNLNEEL